MKIISAINQVIMFTLVSARASFLGNVITLKFWEKNLKGAPKLENPKFYGSVEFDLTKLPQKTFLACDSARHGMKQKLADSYAMTGELTKTTTLKEVVENLEILFSQLEKGEWFAKAKSSKKGESYTLSELEAQFLSAVESGLMTRKQAEGLYALTCPGKVLPMPSVAEIPETEKEDEEEEENAEEKFE